MNLRALIISLAAIVALSSAALNGAWAQEQSREHGGGGRFAQGEGRGRDGGRNFGGPGGPGGGYGPPPGGGRGGYGGPPHGGQPGSWFGQQQGGGDRGGGYGGEPYGGRGESPAYPTRGYPPPYPSAPGGGYGHPFGRGDWRNQQNEVRQAVRDGRHIPLGRAIDAVRQRSPGRELDAGLEPGPDGRTMYRVRWAASNGRRIDYMVDAATGAIVSEQGGR